MRTVINVSIWFLPLREEMEKRRNGSLSLWKEMETPPAQLLLSPRGHHLLYYAKNPKVAYMVYVVAILITATRNTINTCTSHVTRCL